MLTTFVFRLVLEFFKMDQLFWYLFIKLELNMKGKNPKKGISLSIGDFCYPLLFEKFEIYSVYIRYLNLELNPIRNLFRLTVPRECPLRNLFQILKIFITIGLNPIFSHNMSN